MINVFFSFNLLTLILIDLILIIIIYIIDHIRKKLFFNATFEELKNSYTLFLKYLDRYYISNFMYTITASIIYIISTVVLFLFIRYLFLGQMNMLLRLDTSITTVDYSNLTRYLFQYILFLLSIYLYKSLLQILFFKEIIKLRIYLQQFYYIGELHFYCIYNFGEHFCKFIWILSYRIATQTFSNDLFEGDYDSWKHKVLDYNEHNYIKIYNNTYINKIIIKLMRLSSKFNFVASLFYYNAKLFKFISRHISDGSLKFIPFMLTALCLLYDLYNKELYYIYYATFCYFIYYIIINFRRFEQSLESTYIRILQQYFYKNELPYSAQRFFILDPENYINNNKSRQNDSLALFFHPELESCNFGFIFSVLNNMKRGEIKEESIRKLKRDRLFTYLRATIILAFIIINLFICIKLNITIKIFNMAVSTYVLFSICLILIFLASNIFCNTIADEFTKNESFSNVIYKIHYSILFWLIIIIQCYFYWLIILKPELIFMTTDILLQLPYDSLIIKKIYTTEDKISYLFQYFENYISALNSEKQLVDDQRLRYILRQIDFNSLITSDVTLKDIQVYIKLLIPKYNEFDYVSNLIILLEHQRHNMIDCEFYRFYMDPIVNYINFVAIGKIFIHFASKYYLKPMVITSTQTSYINMFVKYIIIFIKFLKDNKK